MKSNKMNIWPGYVASIASLLLSILLLIGVLVIAMSQVDAIVTKRIDVIEQMVKDEKIIYKKVARISTSNETVEMHKTDSYFEVQMPKESNPSNNSVSLIRIVVEMGVYELNGAGLNELSGVIKDANKNNVSWKVIAYRANSSPMSTQDAFGLILQIRNVLKNNGVKSEHITTQLSDSDGLAKGLSKGEVLIELIPSHLDKQGGDA